MSEAKKETALESAEAIAYKALMQSAAKAATDTPEQMREQILSLWNNSLCKTVMAPETYTLSQLAAIAAHAYSRSVQNQLLTEGQRIELNSILNSVAARFNELMARNPKNTSENYVRAIYSCARDRSFSQRVDSIK